MSRSESDALARELGIEFPDDGEQPAPTEEKADAEVRSDAESAGEAGVEASEQPSESAEPAGEESNEDGTDEEKEAKEWADLLRLADGDPKAALRMARAKYEAEAPAQKPDDVGPAPAGKFRTLSEDIEQFYADGGVEKPDPKEKAAFAGLLQRREAALVQALSTVLEGIDKRLAAKEQSEKREKDIAVLAREHPEVAKQLPAFNRWLAQNQWAQRAPVGDAYTIYLSKQKSASARVAAAKVAAAKKAGTTAAAAGIPGASPRGPIASQNPNKTQREMEVFHQMFTSRRALP